MVSYNRALDITSLIALDAIVGNTSTDGRSGYVGERRPRGSFRNTGAAENLDFRHTVTGTARRRRYVS